MAEDLRGRLEVLKDIEAAQKRLERIETSQNMLVEERIKASVRERQEIKKLAKELKEINKERLNALAEEEKGLSSIGSMYKRLTELDRQRITTMAGNSNLLPAQEKAISSIAEINQKIAQLGRDDVVQRVALTEEYNQQLDMLNSIGGVQQDILNNLIEQNELANNYANLSAKQKDFLQKQFDVYDGIKDAIGGVLETASLLTSTMGGMVGISLIGLGKIANAAGEVRSQLGGISDIGTTALSFIDDNAVENIKSLSDEFGGISNVSTELQASTSLISANMGVSGAEAASLLGSFSRLNGNSQDVALDMTKTTQEFAKQNGIIPSKLMGDLAASTEEFALFGRDGGENILRAAGYAQKLGVNMKTISGIADNLLDFETSITKELELSALMGKNINLDKARGLAMAGKLEEATAETLKALGGQAAFNEMDYFQKKASADLLGVTVAELQKMVDNEEQAAELAGTLGGQFSLAGEAVNKVLNKGLGTSLQGLGGMVIAAGQLNNGFGIFGVNLKGIVSGTAQVLKNLLGMVAGPVLKGIKSITSPLMDSFGGTAVSKGLTSFKDKLLQGVGAKPQVPGEDVAAGADKVSKGKGIGEQLKGLASGLKAMGNTKVLFGALNLIPTGLGFVAILPGLPGMLGVSLLGVNAGIGLKSLGVGLKAFGNTQVSLGALNLALAAVGFALMTVGVIGLAGIALLGAAAGAGLTALAGGLAAFGASAAVTIIGIGLLALLGLAMIPLTYALSLLAPLVESIGTAIATMMVGIGQGISMIVTSLGDLLVKVLPLMNLEAAAGIFAVAGAFFTLAGALTAVGVAGIFALPGLLAIQATGAVAGVVGGVIDGMFGGENETTEGGDGGGSMSALLDEIKGLRADLNSGKVAVYLDGKKVTSTVARVANTSSINTYAKR